MGRDYVTIREEDHDGETVWAETSVGRARLKSAPARVTQNDADYRIIGAAWGAPIDRVEVKIDDGPWLPATIDHSEEAEFAWKIWSLDWPNPAPGEHTVTSRAIDTAGQIQPAMDDPLDRQEAHLLGEQRPGDAASSGVIGSCGRSTGRPFSYRDPPPAITRTMSYSKAQAPSGRPSSSMLPRTRPSSIRRAISGLAGRAALLAIPAVSIRTFSFRPILG